MMIPRHLRLWTAFALFTLASLPVEAARRIHLAPAARGDGSGRNAANARRFEAADFNQRVIPDARDFEVEVRFAPGTYPVTVPLNVSGGAHQADYFVRIIGEGEGPEEVVFLNQLPYQPGNHERMARFHDIRRIEIENVTFDGNWDERMKLAGHPSTSFGYKNQPLTATAITGRIRRVIVRHHGAIGFVPHTRFDNPAGVESFPLAVGTIDVGQEPYGDDPRPWVVEDCEIHGFHTEYSGYTTLLMAGAGSIPGQSPAWITTDPERRMILVRRCQIRGTQGGLGVIAMGSSGCGTGYADGGRATFTDNLVLNASLGFNTDCGRISNLDFIHSQFLDIWAIGNANASYPGRMHHYRISDNAVRFGHRQQFGQYRQFTWKGRHMITDLALPLGRPETNDLVGLYLGSTENFDLTRNWFTGRIPAARGPESGPAEFKLLRKLGPIDFPWGGGSAPASGLDGSGNAISQVAWDFSRLQTVPGGKFNSLPVGGGGELTRLRSVPSTPPATFNPIGQVERILPLYGRRSQSYDWLPQSGSGPRRSRVVPDEPALLGSLEVAIGEITSPTPGEWIVPVRLAFQPMPGQGDTRPVAGSNVWLQVSGAIQSSGSGLTDSRGLTEFRLRSSNLTRGQLHLLAFHDPNARLPTQGRFREYHVAFARAHQSVGSVVDVVARPDVADERTGQPARFLFSRTPDLAGNLPDLEVAFRIGRNPRAASFGPDYELELDGPGTLLADNARRGAAARIRFPANVSQLVLQLIPVPDQILEQERVTLELITGSRLPYDLAPNHSATVYLHDGPDWSRQDLPSPEPGQIQVTAISPITRIDDQPAVLIGGILTVRDGLQRPVYWRWNLDSQQPELLKSHPATWDSILPSTFTSTGTSSLPDVAGTIDVPQRGQATGWIQGKRLPFSTRITAANDDGSWWIAQRVQGQSQEFLLGQTGRSPVTPRGDGWREISLAAVDPRGTTVGQGKRGDLVRAFRTSRVDSISNTDALPLLNDTTESGATAINSAGAVAGWCSKGAVRRACVWLPSNPANSLRVVELVRPPNQSESIALGFSITGEVLAMAGKDGILSQPYVASLNHAGIWPLDDPSNVFGATAGAPAGQVVAINPQGWVIGSRPGPNRSTIAWVARRQSRQ